MKHIKLLAILALITQFQSMNCTTIDERNEHITQIMNHYPEECKEGGKFSPLQAYQLVRKVLQDVESNHFKTGAHFEELRDNAIAAFSRKNDFKNDNELNRFIAFSTRQVKQYIALESYLKEVAANNRSWYKPFTSQETLEKNLCQELRNDFDNCLHDIWLESKNLCLDICSVLHPETK